MNRSGHSTRDVVAGIEVEVTYKSVKNLRLRVLPPDGRVAVSVPLGMPAKDVSTFIADNREWLLKARTRVRMASPPVEPLVDGGRARLWGRWYEVRVTEARRAKAELVDGAIAIAAPDEQGRRRALEALYRRELDGALPPLLARWSPLVGHRATTIKLRRMTSRWGTCNTRSGAVTFNTALAEHPVTALEYVVVHELLHFRERGHGPRFVAGMDQLLPDWRTRRSALAGRN